MTRFVVFGEPAPQGSAKAYVVNGRAVVTHASAKTMPWRNTIAAEARQAIPTPTEGPVRVEVTFNLTRPKSHWRKDGLTTVPSAPAWPARRPDIDKLARAVLDALTGVAYLDDAQVVVLNVSKRYIRARQAPASTVITVHTDPRTGDTA